MASWFKSKFGKGYSVVKAESSDPFVKGIYFHGEFIGSMPVKDKHDSPETQADLDKLWKEVLDPVPEKPLTKMTITVYQEGVRVKNADKQTIFAQVPIHRISYCGSSITYKQLFFFIYRNKVGKLVAEVFKFSSEAKVRAAVATVSKSFNIAFKAWQANKRQLDKQKRRAEGALTPTLPSKSTHENNEGVEKVEHRVLETESPKPRPRSGSVPEDTKDDVKVDPAVLRVKGSVTNEKTGSTHVVELSPEFDASFSKLCLEMPSSPGRLRTSFIEIVPEDFDITEVVRMADKGSTENLLDA